MALFGKKTNDTPAPPAGGTTTGEKKRGFGMGRKKDTATPAPGTTPDEAANPDEFFDFSEEALAGANGSTNDAAATTDGDKGTKKTVKPKGLKSGTVVGLNIGADSIKAIELRVKGTEIAITGMGMLPTPEDSIANGVVMSVASLSHAVRDVLQQAGIKSKRVVTSVAGTGALVVRVIEVPKMSDNELEDNMKVDADRYIPFPPSEVIMDFKALRELPSDPDAPNMEVLLAAAQREIIDLHVQVVEGAKLDPRSIDVEPLAAVRALTAREINPNAAGADTIDGTDYVDYNDVSAVVNIGASSTEISIVRGDILVFTRNVPTGGQTLTQAIVDYFGLHWPDAENAKRQWGDALPNAAPQAHTGFGAADSTSYAADGDVPTDSLDDWSEFGLDDTAFDDASAPHAEAGFAATPAANTPAPNTPATSAFDADPFGTVDTTPATPASPATAGMSAQAADPFDLDFNAGNNQQDAGSDAPQAADPFDLDFFSQGPQEPQNKEPGEQHGQKENEKESNDDATKPAPVFDFSNFSFDEDEPSTPKSEAAAGDETELPTLQDSAANAPTLDDDEDTLLPSTVSTSTTVSSAFDFPSTAVGPSFAEDEDDESSLPTVISDAGAATDAVPVSTADPDEDDDAALPTLAETPGATVAGSAAAGSTPGAASSFSLADSDFGAPSATAATETSAAIEPEAENFDFDLTPEAAPTAEATVAPVIPVAEDDDDFDIDSLFGDSPSATPANAATMPDNMAGTGTTDSDAGLETPPFAAESGLAADIGDFAGFDSALQGFGAGLTDTGISGIDEQALYGVLHPILDGLAAEIRRSLEYHATRYPDAAVQHITLIGGGAKLKNIDAYFAQSLGIPTTVNNPLAGITVQAPKLPPDYATETGPLFVVALGLALRDLVR